MDLRGATRLLEVLERLGLLGDCRSFFSAKALCKGIAVNVISSSGMLKAELLAVGE